MKQRYRQSGGILDCLDRDLSPGVYWVQTSSGDINLPDGLVYGSLIVLSKTIRLFVAYKSATIYVNDYVNSVWQGWKKYESEVNFTTNAPYVKTWNVFSEWVPNGGNVPDGVVYGNVLRLYGDLEPGRKGTFDSSFLLVSYVNSEVSRFYTGHYSDHDSVKIPWTLVG